MQWFLAHLQGQNELLEIAPHFGRFFASPFHLWAISSRVISSLLLISASFSVSSSVRSGKPPSGTLSSLLKAPHASNLPLPRRQEFTIWIASLP